MTATETPVKTARDFIFASESEIHREAGVTNPHEGGYHPHLILGNHRLWHTHLTAAAPAAPPDCPPQSDDWRSGYRAGMSYCLSVLRPMIAGNTERTPSDIREAIRMLDGQIPNQ